MGTGASKSSQEHTSAASLDSGLGANSVTSQLYPPSEPLQGREEIGRKTSSEHTFGEDSYFSDIASLTMALRPITPSASAFQYARSFSKNKAMQEELKESKHPELKPVFLLFEEVKNVLTLNKNKTEKMFGRLNKLLQDKILSPFEEFADEERREVMGNKLAKIEFVKVAVDYYDFVLEEQGIRGVTTDFFIEERESQNPGLTLVLKLREVFWNFSDGSCSYSEKLAETKLLHLLVGDLEEMLDDIDELEHNENILPFSSAVGIIHNCARNKDIDGDVFRDIDTIGKLHPFLKSSDVYVQMVTLLALGNLINFDDSSQVCLLDTGKDVVTFVFDAIKDALASEDRRAHGFTVSELVYGLASLAQRDSSKAKIMSLSPLETIKQILRRNEKPDDHYSQYNSEVVSEKLAAVRLVWELAFVDRNKKIISADQEMVNLVQELKLHSDPELRSAACGACFMIVEKDKAIREHTKIKKQHIMISYQWSDQKTILKINEFLEKNGFKTWVDVKFMHEYGNVLEGMAKAVEGASMVLICFSEKYKKSQNCRTEAEFVFVCKKPFVCLKMQRGYTADGWLGALLGAKLFIDFSGKYKFEDKLAELQDRLRDVGTLEVPVPQTPPPRPVPPVGPTTLENWKKYDVEHWASRNNMESGRLFNKVRSVTGPQLAFLYNVYKQAPETFYRWTESKLKLDALEDIMRFTKAIEELGQFV